MMLMMVAFVAPLFVGAVSDSNSDCAITPSTCNFVNVMAVFGDVLLVQHFDYACENVNQFGTCLNSLPGCAYADPQLSEYRGYYNALVYLCQQRVKQAVLDNAECISTVNMSAINESCSWTPTDNSDYCTAENTQIKCMYNASVQQCGPAVGQIVSVITIKIATPQLYLHTDDYCELFNDEASCFPSLTPDVCGMSSMSPISNLQSLQTYYSMCNNSVSFASCAGNVHCLTVDDMYNYYQQLQWLVMGVQYACSENASRVLTNHIDCIATIDLTSGDYLDCVSQVNANGDACRYTENYVRCVNSSITQQCGEEVAGVYTLLSIEVNGLYATLYNCSVIESITQPVDNCTLRSTTCNFSNVTAVLGDVFSLQHFDNACENVNRFGSCLNSLPGCAYADPKLSEYRGYYNALVYLCQQQVKQAVLNNSLCMSSLNFSTMNESCAWTFSAINDFCAAENTYIKCMYNASVQQCGPVVGQIVSVITIKIATPQLYLLTDDYCELFNDQASCFPSLTPDICGMSGMSPLTNLQSLQTYGYMCNNSASFASCAGNVHCLTVDDMYNYFQQLQWLVMGVQYACSENASRVITTNIDCIATIDPSSSDFLTCVSSIPVNASTCRYAAHYVNCTNNSIRQQCGGAVADVYTTLTIATNGLRATLNNCSMDLPANGNASVTTSGQTTAEVVNMTTPHFTAQTVMNNASDFNGNASVTMGQTSAAVVNMTTPRYFTASTVINTINTASGGALVNMLLILLTASVMFFSHPSSNRATSW